MNRAERSARLNAAEGEIIASYQAGESLKVLAERFAVSPQTMNGRLRRWGVPARTPQRRGLTRAQKKEVAERYKAGLRSRELARIFGVSKPTILSAVAEMGVKRRPAHRPPGETARYRKLWIPPDHPLAAMRPERGYVMAHRLIMAEKIGRPLRPGETVHHINGDGLDNRPENLELRQGNHGPGQRWKCSNCGSHDLEPAALN
jgi:DNA-binding CsgD family transcriptional regulator